MTWAEPAEFVLAALRNNGNTTTKIVTLDLSEPLALDMVKGGNVAAIVADEAYGIGQTLARAAAASLMKKLRAVPAVDALAVTKDNVKEGWHQSLHRDPPASLTGGQSMAGKLSALRAVDPSRYVVYVGFLLILVGFSIVLRDDGFLTARNLLNIVQQTDARHRHGGRHGLRADRRRDRPFDRVDRRRSRRFWRRSCCATNLWFLGAAAGLPAGAAIGGVNGALVAYHAAAVVPGDARHDGPARRRGALADRPPIGADHQRDVQQPVRRRQPLRRAVAADLDGCQSSPSAISSIARRRFGAHVHAIGDNARKRPRRRHQASTASASR